MAVTERTEQLIQSYLDGCCLPAELAELASLLVDDPQVADAFARASRFEGLLDQHLVERRAESDLLVEVLSAKSATSNRNRPAPAGRFPSASFLWRGLTAAVLLIAAGGSIWWKRTDSTNDSGHQVVSGRVLVNGVEASIIPDGSQVEVLGAAAATIRLSDGSAAQLSPATAAVIRDGSAGPVVELDHGSGKFRSQNPGHSLRVDTPAGVVLGRGTEFAVDLQSPAHTGVNSMNSNLLALLTVAVLTGQVEVQSTDQKVKVSSGESRAFPVEKKPMFAGRVTAVSADGKRLTLEGRPPKPGVAPEQREITITEQTQLAYFGVPKDGDKPTVGYAAVAWLDKNALENATLIEFGTKAPQLTGVVAAASEDGRSVTLDIYHKGGPPTQRAVKLSDRTRVSYSVEADEQKPTIGYHAAVWLESDSDVAIEIRYTFKRKGSAPEGSPKKTDKAKPEKPVAEKPKADKPDANPTEKPGKPGEKPAAKPEKPEPKPEKPQASPEKPQGKPERKESQPQPTAKPDKPVKTEKSQDQALKPGKPGVTGKPIPAPLPRRVSSRSPGPVTADIDCEIDQRLAESKIPASPPADDAEFLRRACLDITGRIPTFAATRRFLDSNDPAKRQKLIDELLSSPDFGQHFGTIWKRLIVPRQVGTAKPQVDKVTPWLADEFSRNRGWNEIVYELLTTDANLARDPQACFLAAGSESFEPKPNLLAASTGRLFLGVQLACAECHNHPFAEWKQTEFWGLAAFFGRLHKRSKMDFALTEEPVDSSAAAAASITIPPGGKGAGQVVAARFLGGAEPQLSGAALRPILAEWVTANGNPYFSRAAVNRLWANFFGRGLVEPLDGFQDGYVPSHPQVLDRLAAEFVASGYDVQHIVRCLCNTRAYQRTGRPLPENEADSERLSHMAIKVLSPDALYDSLIIALNGDPNPIALGKNGKAAPPSFLFGSRDEFANFFSGPTDDARPGQYAHGIPQLLRLMNADAFNVGAPLARAVANVDGTPEKKIALLYLAALTRRPTADETRLLTEYVARRQGDEQAYAGALWILLNTSEFVLNR